MLAISFIVSQLKINYLLLFIIFSQEKDNNMKQIAPPQKNSALDPPLNDYNSNKDFKIVR